METSFLRKQPQIYPSCTTLLSTLIISTFFIIHEGIVLIDLLSIFNSALLYTHGCDEVELQAIQLKFEIISWKTRKTQSSS